MFSELTQYLGRLFARGCHVLRTAALMYEPSDIVARKEEWNDENNESEVEAPSAPSPKGTYIHTIEHTYIHVEGQDESAASPSIAASVAPSVASFEPRRRATFIPAPDEPATKGC